MRSYQNIEFVQIEIPRYFLFTRGPIVLDGDIYKIFGFKTVACFRKFLKQSPSLYESSSFFRLNSFEKGILKEENPDIPWLNTSAQTFAFFESFFNEDIKQLF